MRRVVAWKRGAGDWRLEVAWYGSGRQKVGCRSAHASHGNRASRPGTFSDEDLALYRAAWARPGALTGMLHWYRG